MDYFGEPKNKNTADQQENHHCGDQGRSGTTPELGRMATLFAEEDRATGAFPGQQATTRGGFRLAARREREFFADRGRGGGEPYLWFILGKYSSLGQLKFSIWRLYNSERFSHRIIRIASNMPRARHITNLMSTRQIIFMNTQ